MLTLQSKLEMIAQETGEGQQANGTEVHKGDPFKALKASIAANIKGIRKS